VVGGLQAKVGLDLPKFELLLSAAKNYPNQHLSSTTEGNSFYLFKASISFSWESLLTIGAFQNIKNPHSPWDISRSLSREETPHDNQPS
jgi:hypothetical protein